MTQVVEILPHIRQKTYLIYIANVMMNADVMVMQEARASETMIFTMLNQND